MTATKLATFCSKVIVTKLVIGKLVQLKSRNLYKTIDQHPSRDSQMKMSSYNESLENFFLSLKIECLQTF